MGEREWNGARARARAIRMVESERATGLRRHATIRGRLASMSMSIQPCGCAPPVPDRGATSCISGFVLYLVLVLYLHNLHLDRAGNDGGDLSRRSLEIFESLLAFDLGTAKGTCTQTRRIFCPVPCTVRRIPLRRTHCVRRDIDVALHQPCYRVSGVATGAHGRCTPRRRLADLVQGQRDRLAA